MWWATLCLARSCCCGQVAATRNEPLARLFGKGQLPRESRSSLIASSIPLSSSGSGPQFGVVALSSLIALHRQIWLSVSPDDETGLAAIRISLAPGGRGTASSCRGTSWGGPNP
ncbi:MAG: hypothetical protein JWM63_1086 [Gammaproteobacteria bacterium]|nr:hypothetical protein [Gammaproteobacteria bacterium]